MNIKDIPWRSALVISLFIIIITSFNVVSGSYDPIFTPSSGELSIGLFDVKALNNCTCPGSGGGGNPFDQSLNTTDSPAFAQTHWDDPFDADGYDLYAYDTGIVQAGPSGSSFGYTFTDDGYGSWHISSNYGNYTISESATAANPRFILERGSSVAIFLNSTGSRFFAIHQPDGSSGVTELYGVYPKHYFYSDAGILKATMSANTATGQIVYGTPGGFKVAEAADASGNSLIDVRGDSLMSIGYNTASAFPSQLFVKATYGNAPVTRFQANAAQTENMSEWTDSSGKIRAYMDKDFGLHVPALDAPVLKEYNVMCYAYYTSEGNNTRAVWCARPAQAPRAESSERGWLGTAAPVTGNITKVTLVASVHTATAGNPIYVNWIRVRNDTQYNLSQAAQFNLTQHWQTFTNDTIRVPVTQGDELEMGYYGTYSPVPSNVYRSAIITIEGY